MRLDIYLFEKHLAQSRQKAQELIDLGVVYLNGKVCSKNSICVGEQDRVEVYSTQQWVARSGEKLDRFLKNHLVEISHKRVLDIGSSTGGFTQVLLSYGANEVVCVDVGENQLHSTLKNHPKITFYEKQDIRTFQSEPFELIVCDVSFISLRLIIEKINQLCKGECVLLFKPQFEVGRGVKRNKKGVILDAQSICQALEQFLDLVQGLGFTLIACQKSEIKGKNGNEEFFIHLQKS